MCPIAKTQINVNKPIWFNQTSYESRKECDRLFKKIRNSLGTDDSIYQQAVRKRHECANLLKVAKENYYQDLLEINKDNSMKSGSKDHKCFYYNTNILCKEAETVNIINDFFASVGERVWENLASLNHIQLDDPTESNLCEFPLMTIEVFLNIMN